MPLFVDMNTVKIMMFGTLNAFTYEQAFIREINDAIQETIFTFGYFPAYETELLHSFL